MNPHNTHTASGDQTASGRDDRHGDQSQAGPRSQHPDGHPVGEPSNAQVGDTDISTVFGAMC